MESLVEQHQRLARLDRMHLWWRRAAARRRSTAGMSAAALSRAANVSTSTIRRIEDLGDGRHPPRPYWPEGRTLICVSYALGWTLDDLVAILADDAPELRAILTLHHDGTPAYYHIAIAHGAVAP